MPAMFTEGFFVRIPAWHKMGVVLDEYPGRAKAYVLAGHDYTVIERPNGNLGRELTKQQRDELIMSKTPVAFDGEKWTTLDIRDEKKGLYCYQMRDGEPGPVHGNFIEVANDTFELFQNNVAWDLAEELFNQGFKLETGITLNDGATCALTLKLDEPVRVDGDDSPTAPFGCLSWAHDGSGSLRGRVGTIRQVCANTVAASEAEGARNGSAFTIRHTKNGMERVEEAKKMLSTARADIQTVVTVMNKLGEIEVTEEIRREFIASCIGDRVVSRSGEVTYLSKTANTTPRVKGNIERDRTKIESLFMGPTIPEAHRETAYGLHLAGVEFFDHLRNFKSQESYVTRTLLAHSSEKTSLVRTISDLTGVTVTA